VREAQTSKGRPIGVYAELKGEECALVHSDNDNSNDVYVPKIIFSLSIIWFCVVLYSAEPFFFRKQCGFDMEGILYSTLQAKDFPRLEVEEGIFDADKDGPKPLIIQCFDADTLRSLAKKLPEIPRVQLLLGPESHEDKMGISYLLGRQMVYGPDLMLTDVASYAQGIGPEKDVYMAHKMELSRAMVEEAHMLGLAVHPWTFRREQAFVDKAFRGDSENELRYFYQVRGCIYFY